MENLIDSPNIPFSSMFLKERVNELAGEGPHHILHDFRTSTPFKKKPSDHFTDLHKMELLTNFDISLTSFLGGVMN